MYQKNDLLDVEIVDMTNEGEGVGKTADGFTFFVKDTVVGDKATIKIIKLKKNYGYGRLEKLISLSEARVEEKCPVARSCGGCQLQAMSYKAQLAFKEKKVFNNLVRIGAFEEALINSVMEPIIGACDEQKDASFGYRNKAQFPFGVNREGETICGFYAGRTHSIISNSECILGVDENKDILSAILLWMKKYDIKPYDETSQKGYIRHALIRKGFRTGEIMVCLVVNADKCPRTKELVSALISLNENFEKEFGSRIKSISLSVNKENTNVIMGNTYETLWGDSVIRDVMKVNGQELEFDISPLSFYQVNPVQVEKLYGTAIEFAGLTGKEEVWDLCCGIGTITLAMAKDAKFVHGIEIVPQAIEDAKKNAIRNKIENSEFICAPAEKYLPEHEDSVKADVIVMDPPRKGMDEEALRVVADAAPSRIVYVSCDSATLARDLRYLCDRGYELKRVRACDMFSQTVHVETVCLLSKLHEAKHHVSVKLDMDEMDLTAAESKATYEEIKKYVAEHNDGMKVSNLYIAQVKRKCGLELAENFNLPKSEDSKQPQCPKEKEEAIMEALKAFHII